MPSWVLLGLALAYGLTLARTARSTDAVGRADPLSPQGRAVERAMAEGRLSEALALAQELRRAFPRDPFVLYLLATIHGSLGQHDAEAATWDAYLEMSDAPGEACPAVGLAYERVGDLARALERFRRCASFEPDEPDRMADLADAYHRRGDLEAARDAYRRAAALDPRNPHVVAMAATVDVSRTAR